MSFLTVSRIFINHDNGKKYLQFCQIIFPIGILFSINILFVSTSSSDNESGTESKGKSPILSRKKIRQDSCSSGALVNGAMPDSVAAS